MNRSPDATVWRPHQGSSCVVVGRVAAVGVWTTPYDTFGAPAVLIDHGGQRVLVLARHSLLNKELRRLQPRPGDVVRILFQGRVGTRYQYAVEIGRATR